MDQRISSIALGVADLARSRRFYEDGLGWKCGGTETEIALYQVGGMVLALFSRAGAVFACGAGGGRQPRK